MTTAPYALGLTPYASGLAPWHAARRRITSRRLTLGLAMLCFLVAGTTQAQVVQLTPFAGYRFGGDLYEEITATSLDLDGAPSFGGIADIFVNSEGLSFTFLYSHQEVEVDVPASGGAVRTADLLVDHWMAGGTQDIGRGWAVPFLSGLLGLTRFGGDGDSEVRFSLAGGGGVKLLPTEHVGVRLDGRVYAVFVDGGASTGVCSPSLCVVALDAAVLWQAELTAGVVVSF